MSDFPGAVGQVDDAVTRNKSFDTLAAAIADTGLVDGDLVTTIDYRSTARGGGAPYLIKTAAQATADGDVIDGFFNHALANGNVAIIQLSDDVVNVRQGGAVGDNSTDDTPSFKAAIDFGGALPHRVYAPSGTYRITETLYTYKEGMAFVGESIGASRLNFAAGILGLVGGNSPTTSNDVHNMLIEDLHLSGGTHPLQLGSVTSPLSYLGQVNRVRCSDGTISGLNIHQMIASCNDLMLTENAIGMTVFNDANGGGFPTASQFTRCRFWNNTNQGMYAEHMLGFDFYVCTFESNGTQGTEFSHTDAAALKFRFIHFNSCHWENNMTAGGTLSASILFTKVDVFPQEEISFTDCLFSGVQNFPSNVNVKGEVTKISFINNRSIGPSTGGINLVTPTATGLFIGENRNDLSQERELQIFTYNDMKLQKPTSFTKNTSLGKALFDNGSTAGLETREDLGGITYMSRAGNPTTINRLLTDGQLILLRKDGVTRGAIGTNASSAIFEFIDSGPFSSAGSGTPEGALSAPIGSTFHRADGGANTSFYVKESGAGNTGWVAK